MPKKTEDQDVAPLTPTLPEVDLDLSDAPAACTVRALHPIKHDGKLYGPDLPDGDELTVTLDEQVRLIALGVIEASSDEV